MKRLFVFRAYVALIFVISYAWSTHFYIAAATMPPSSQVETRLLDSDTTLTSVTIYAARPCANIIAKNRRAFHLLDSQEVARAGLTLSQLQSLAAFHDLAPTSLDDFWFVAQFQHGVKNRRPYESIALMDEGQFWVAAIPKRTRVSKLILQTDWFNDGTAAHVQLRYRLDHPILLIPQNEENGQLQLQLNPEQITDQRTQPDLALRLGQQSATLIAGDIVYSLFGLPSEGGSNRWDFKAGLLGDLSGARTLSSIDHIASMKLATDHVAQVTLNMPSASSNVDLSSRALEVMLQRGNALIYREIYHLTFASCISEVFHILQALGFPVETNIVSPFRIAPYLQSLNLVQEELPPLGAEYRVDTPRTISSFARKYSDAISSAEFDEVLRVISYQMLLDRWSNEDYDYFATTLQQVLTQHPNLANHRIERDELLAILDEVNPPSPELKAKLTRVLDKVASLSSAKLQFVISKMLLSQTAGN